MINLLLFIVDFDVEQEASHGWVPRGDLANPTGTPLPVHCRITVLHGYHSAICDDRQMCGRIGTLHSVCVYGSGFGHILLVL
jgi:hypothetical protein